MIRLAVFDMIQRALAEYPTGFPVTIHRSTALVPYRRGDWLRLPAHPYSASFGIPLGARVLRIGRAYASKKK